ncbi:MAG: phosphodiester glycosidase family protein [Oscillospiraceae bacterium]
MEKPTFLRKPLAFPLLILLDLVLAAVVLGVFALFYLWLPKEGDQNGILVISKDAYSNESKMADAFASRFGSDSSSAADTAATTIGTSADTSAETTADDSSKPDDDSSDAATTTKPATTTKTPTKTNPATTTETPTQTTPAATTPTGNQNTVTQTANSYLSNDVSVTITKHETGSGSNKITYFVADVYIAKIESFRTAFAQGKYGKNITQLLTGMDADNDAIIAVAGDYYGNSNTGVVIRNGTLYRDTLNSSDVCILFYDGTMKTYSPNDFDVDAAVSAGAYQSWSFGPQLLDENGNVLTKFNTTSYLLQSHPRTAIGYYEPGHYCFVTVDGRNPGYSKGMNLTELAAVMKGLGCKQAYNLDGGKSAVMTFKDAVYNLPDGGGRELSDCLLIKEPD